MLKKNVIAIDYSGSTYSQKNYWEKVKSVLEKTNDIDTVYTFWDHRENPEITKKERAKEIIELLIKGEGYGGTTDPSTFIPVLVKESSLEQAPKEKEEKKDITLSSEERNDNNKNYVYSVSVRELREIDQAVINKKLDLSKISSTSKIPNEIVCNYSFRENDEENIRNTPTKVCCSTFRPYTQDPVSGVPWDKNSESNFGPLKYQIHLHKYLHDYVAHNKKFPSASNNYSNFIKYLSQGQAKEGIYTLPAPIVPMIEKLMRSYLVAAKEFFYNSEEIIKALLDMVVTEETKSYIIEKLNETNETEEFFVKGKSQEARETFMKHYKEKKEAKVLSDKEEKAKNDFKDLFEKAKHIYNEKNESFTLDDFGVELFTMVSRATRHISNREVLQKLAPQSQTVCNSENNRENDSHNSSQKSEGRTPVTEENDSWLRAPNNQKSDSHGADIDRWLRASSNQADASHSSAQKKEEKTHVTGTDIDSWLRVPSNQKDDSHHSAQKQVTGSGNDRWLQDTKKGQTFFDSPSSSNQQDDSHHSAIKSDQPNYLSKRN